jgi:hypothetical protein
MAPGLPRTRMGPGWHSDGTTVVRGWLVGAGLQLVLRWVGGAWATWGALGGSWGQYLEHHVAPPTPWGAPAPPWGLLGVTCGHSGIILSYLGAILGHHWASLGHPGAPWAILAHFGNMRQAYW